MGAEIGAPSQAWNKILRRRWLPGRPAVMKLTEKVWVSDNSDPFDGLLMQDGFSPCLRPGSDDGLGEGPAEFRQQPRDFA